jgi:hypothetical protein
VNDYLDSLVTRSLGVAQAVQPRPVSLYEPLPGLEALPSAQAEIVQERPARGEPAADLAPRSQPAAAHLPAGPPGGGLGAEPEIQGTGAALRQHPAARAAPGPETPARGAWAALAERPPIAPAPGAQVRPSPLAEAAPSPPTRPSPSRVGVFREAGPGAEPIVAERRVAPSPSPTAGTAEAAAQPLKPADTGARAAQGRRATRRAEIVAAPPALPAGDAETTAQAAEPGSRTPPEVVAVRPVAAPPAGLIAQPQVKRAAAEMPSSRAQPAARAESAPAIQVTIGRIEVRATPPPPVPAKQAPRLPAMSLEEYLSQRKEGTP